MRAYFTDADNTTYAYDDKHTDLSYQELYAIYQPSVSSIRAALKTQRAERSRIKQLQYETEQSLSAKVPFAKLDIAVELVGAATWYKRLAKVEELIATNEGILRIQSGKSHAHKVIAIPITDFMQFRMGWTKCPFHADTHASLKLYPKDNRVHCFAGCGQKNVIQVYAQLKSLSTKEAYRQLAQSLV